MLRNPEQAMELEQTRQWLEKKMQEQEAIVQRDPKLYDHSKQAGMFGLQVDDVLAKQGSSVSARIEMLNRTLRHFANAAAGYPEVATLQRAWIIEGAAETARRLRSLNDTICEIRGTPLMKLDGVYRKS